MLGVVNAVAIYLSLGKKLTAFPLKPEKDTKSESYVRRVNFYFEQMCEYYRSQKNTLLHFPLIFEKVLAGGIKTKVVKFLLKKSANIVDRFIVTFSPPFRLNLKRMNE